jgi:hypothetical protein
VEVFEDSESNDTIGLDDASNTNPVKSTKSRCVVVNQIVPITNESW